jgi:hypothetical protein
MFDASYLKAPDRLEGAILRLPIRVRIEVARGERAPAPVNIVRIARSLLSDDEWERTPSIFKIDVFAPHWTAHEMRAFVEGPVEAGHLGADAFHLAPGSLRALRARKPFAELGATSADRTVPIVYTTVRLGDLKRTEGLDEALARAQTRLLVVHYDLGDPEAPRIELLKAFGKERVRAGLPAFLAVGTPAAKAADEYFHDLFERITHDKPLESLARPSRTDVSAVLVGEDNAQAVLSLQPIVDAVDRRIAKKLGRATLQKTRLRQRRSFLHDLDFSALDARLERTVAPLTQQRVRLQGIRASNMIKESEGIVPLQQVASAVAAAPRPPDVAKAVNEPARVLNAALQQAGNDVGAETGLQRATEYALAVQIGPLWKERRTVVAGTAKFPDEALNDGSASHVLDVVFLSEDIEPDTIEAKLWLPRSGLSRPWMGEAPAPEPADVLLPFRTRAAGDAASPDLDGRLNIYFEHTLLQSARVRGQFAPPGTAAARAFEVKVDYAVTGSLAKLDDFAGRNLLRSDGVVEKHTVGLTLTQNGNGDRHRIIAKGGGLPAVWRPYDAQGNTIAVNNARAGLFECLRNGADKNFDGFIDDLYKLALIGSSLYDKAFMQLDVGDDTLLTYVRKLDQTLQDKTVIQIARTAQAQNVFPWALVYDIRMNHPDRLNWCPVIGKGPLPWTDGPQNRCPHKSEHKDNMLCPYGFWGFRHVIEQPLAALPAGAGDDVLGWGERKQQKPRPAPIGFTVGVTRDPEIVALVDDHLRNLAALGSVTPPGGAVTWTSVEANLRAAELLYFLCHGEVDTTKPEAYIAIGQTGKLFDERVYPSAMFQWGRAPEIVGPAMQNTPLVMINGCHTVALTADDLVTFVKVLASLGASGVVGTEVAVPVDFAAAFALTFLTKLVKDKLPVGEALYETRWEFARRGNLLGLVYTPYCFADLAVVM